MHYGSSNSDIIPGIAWKSFTIGGWDWRLLHPQAWIHINIVVTQIKRCCAACHPASQRHGGSGSQCPVCCAVWPSIIYKSGESARNDLITSRTCGQFCLIVLLFPKYLPFCGAAIFLSLSHAPLYSSGFFPQTPLPSFFSFTYSASHLFLFSLCSPQISLCLP